MNKNEVRFIYFLLKINFYYNTSRIAEERIPANKCLIVILAELSTFRFAGQLPGNGAPLKVASSHNFKGHSSSVSPPATKGYQMGIGAKPKFGSSSSGGKMPTSKIAPQRKSPYAKSKKAAVSTLRKSCSTSNLQKVRTSVNPQQSKSKPQQQHDKSKWQPK